MRWKKRLLHSASMMFSALSFCSAFSLSACCPCCSFPLATPGTESYIILSFSLCFSVSLFQSVMQIYLCPLFHPSMFPGFSCYTFRKEYTLSHMLFQLQKIPFSVAPGFPSAFRINAVSRVRLFAMFAVFVCSPACHCSYSFLPGLLDLFAVFLPSCLFYPIYPLYLPYLRPYYSMYLFIIYSIVYIFRLIWYRIYTRIYIVIRYIQLYSCILLLHFAFLCGIIQA